MIEEKMQDDLISRQAAIDAFDCTDELIVSGSANAQNVMNYINKVIGKIKALPPAQPEQRWISSGKKPLKEGSYLVWMPFAPPKHRMAVAEYCGGYWNIKTPISAWMPLPDPYGGEQDDKQRSD